MPICRLNCTSQLKCYPPPNPHPSLSLDDKERHLPFSILPQTDPQRPCVCVCVWYGNSASCGECIITLPTGTHSGCYWTGEHGCQTHRWHLLSPRQGFLSYLRFCPWTYICMCSEQPPPPLHLTHPPHPSSLVYI